MIFAVHHYMDPAFEPYVFVGVMVLCAMGAVLGGYFVLSGILQLMRPSTHQLTCPEHERDGEKSECP